MILGVVGSDRATPASARAVKRLPTKLTPTSAASLPPRTGPPRTRSTSPDKAKRFQPSETPRLYTVGVIAVTGEAEASSVATCTSDGVTARARTATRTLLPPPVIAAGVRRKLLA